MSLLDPPASQDGPTLVGGATYSYNGVPLSPLHTPSQPHYDYGNYQSPLAQSSSTQWPGDNSEQGEVDMYPSSSQMSYAGMSYGDSSYGEPLSTIDSSYLDFGGTSDMLSGLSTTPPTASFDAPGLPFRGLDFIRNYNPGGYSVGDQDSLWHTFDAGAFGYDPDTPFTLPDLLNDVRDGHQ
jgi:hypothetical protein